MSDQHDEQPPVDETEPETEPETGPEGGAEAEAVESTDATPVSTGHPAVDEVLRSLDGLDGRPVDEHVAAFEQAHETLRQTLSGAGDETGDETGDVGATPAED